MVSLYAQKNANVIYVMIAAIVNKTIVRLNVLVYVQRDTLVREVHKVYKVHKVFKVFKVPLVIRHNN